LENLSSSKHTYDLEAADFTTLNIDYKNMGVGGDDSWNPRTHKEFLVEPVSYSFSYIITPHRKNNKEDINSIRISKMPLPEIISGRNEFVESMTVEIKSDIAGSEIRYTTDGSVPTANSEIYKEKITIKQSTTLRAIVVMNGFDDSEIAKAKFSKIEKIFESHKLTGDVTNSISVDISKFEKLILVVKDGGDGTSKDHADWADAKFITNKDEIIYISDLEEEYYKQGWNVLGKDKSVEGTQILLSGIEYKKGLGTHSESKIVYLIPQDVVRFESVIGIDDEVGKLGSAQFILFVK